MFHAYLIRSFSSQTATAKRKGTLRQPPQTTGTDWEDRARFTMLHLLVSGCWGGRGHRCGRAFAVIRERNWLKVFVRSFTASTCVSSFLCLLFVHGLCQYRKPWRMSYKQQVTRVTCAHATVLEVYSMRMHISLRSSLPPLQCCNSGLFFFVGMKVQITQ